jgi:hypothetical protein
LYEQSFSSIRNLISKGQNDVAENEICNALSGITSEAGWEIFDELTTLAAELRDNGAISEADRCETKILEKLVKHSSASDDIAYIVLKRAFFRGQYQLVCNSEFTKASSGQSALLSYRFARLRARSAGSTYWEYYSTHRGWPDDEEIAQFKHLAKNSTRLSEISLSKAPSSLDKVQLAAEWLHLNINCYYEADSQVLRNAMLLNLDPSSGLTQSTIDSQIEDFRKATQNALLSSKQLNQLSTMSKEQLVDILTSEYNKIAVWGIPDEVFDDLLEDMKLFLDIGLPLKLIKNDEISFIETLQWYLRQAVVKSRPDEIEKKIIEHQVFTFGKLLREEIVQNMSIPNSSINQVEDFVESEWIKKYLLLQNNAFFPLYRQGLIKHQFQYSVKDLKESCQRVGLNISKRAADIARIQNFLDRAGQTNREKDNMPTSNFDLKTFLAEAFFSYGKWAGPDEIHLPPDLVIFSQGATLNDYGVYAYVPKKYRSVPPFPYKKQFKSTTINDLK